MLNAVNDLRILIPQELPPKSFSAFTHIIFLTELVIFFCLFANHLVKSFPMRICQDRGCNLQKEKDTF